MKRNKIKQYYYKDTLKRWKDGKGKPTEHYTKWVEDKLMWHIENKIY